MQRPFLESDLPGGAVQHQAQDGLRGNRGHAGGGAQANGGMGAASTLIGLQRPVSFAQRRPFGGGGGAEQADGRHAQPGGEMQRPGVPGNY